MSLDRLIEQATKMGSAPQFQHTTTSWYRKKISVAYPQLWLVNILDSNGKIGWIPCTTIKLWIVWIQSPFLLAKVWFKKKQQLSVADKHHKSGS
jgi:hypothetical protein